MHSDWAGAPQTETDWLAQWRLQGTWVAQAWPGDSARRCVGPLPPEHAAAQILAPSAHGGAQRLRMIPLAGGTVTQLILESRPAIRARALVRCAAGTAAQA